jgi:hypothetical protein
MTRNISTSALLGIALAALSGCANLDLYEGGPAFDDNSMVLRAAPDTRGSDNGNRGNAQNDSQRRGTDNDGDNGRDDDLGVNINIGFEEARRLAVANQLTGYDSLPPGIRKNLARGKPLPPGIAKRMVPSSMLGQLPVIDAHEWQISGTDLVLVEMGTMLVVELLADVFE